MAVPEAKAAPRDERAVIETLPRDEAEDKKVFADMKAYFASRPKVSIKTREDEWVQINGYTFIIKGGERVEVPQDVADILEETGRI